MPLNASEVAGNTGHVADHNTIAVFVNTHDDVDTATTAHHHTLGTGADQAAAGNHVHVDNTTPQTIVTTGDSPGTSTTAARVDHVHTQGAHTHHDTANGGQLAQADTHQSADTDFSSTSLHHTLGTGANQASAGNHTHTGGASGVYTSSLPIWIAATSQSVGVVNQAFYYKFHCAGSTTVSALTVYVASQSGAMDVGIYSDSSGLPGSRLGSAGGVVTPAPGALQSISLTGSVNLVGGTSYWFAISANNTSASFACNEGPYGTPTSAAVLGGIQKVQSSAYPLPATATPATNTYGYTLFIGFPN